jgi:hypothetical protein
MAPDLDPRAQSRLNRAVFAGRLVVLWERSAVIWTPFLLAAGVVAVVALWGAFDRAPAFVQALAVALAFVVALAFAVHGALKIRLPDREEMLRRMEEDSGLDHAPLTLFADKPALGDGALWDLHRKHAAEAARTARVGPPRAGLAAADPYALRYALLIAAALALWARGPEHGRDAALAFRPAANVVAAGGEAVSAAVDGLVNDDVQSSAQIPGKPRSLPAESRP